MLHAMMLEVTNGKLFFAPISEHPQKILDLGTGTGIWAIEGTWHGAPYRNGSLPAHPRFLPTGCRARTLMHRVRPCSR